MMKKGKKMKKKKKKNDVARCNKPAEFARGRKLSIPGINKIN